MKARYHLQVHCGDDSFQGPEEIRLDEASAVVTLQKNQKNKDPGILDLYVDFKIDHDEILEKGGVLIPPNKTRELQNVGLYIADVLTYQTGWGELLGNPSEAFAKFIPENDADKRFLQGKKIRYSKSIPLSYSVYGGNLIRVDEIKRLYRHRDAIACYGEASRMEYPISVYRELYRIIEYFFARPQGVTKRKRTRMQGIGKVIERASNYLKQFDQKYDEKFLKDLYDLRKRCSHTAKDYITPNDMEGLEMLRTKIPELKEIARILIANPPP